MSCAGEYMLRLRSKDGKEFKVAPSAAVLSQTIKFAMEYVLGDDGDCGSVIPIPTVDGKILAKVLEYCGTHADASKTRAEKKEFDRRFVEVDQAVLYDLLMAANYLEINALLDILIQRVADMIKGKSAEEIRKIFHIKNDFTPEEEEKIKKDNAWAFN